MAENEHLKTLSTARANTIEARREIASGLAETYKKGHTEILREMFVRLQATIEEIGRAHV